MLFLMKNNVNPLWEDKHNRNGGCFSFKVSNKNVVSTWKNLIYCLVGCTIVDKKYIDNITGITISPKKAFCIIKIWLTDCTLQNPKILSNFANMDISGCIFKKHLR